MLSKCLFQFGSSLLCPAILREAAKIVQSLFEHREVCRDICDPIVKHLPVLGDATCYNQADLYKTVRNCLSSCIKVQFDPEQTTLAKVCLSKNILHINPGYCVYDETSQEQHDRCLLLLVIKLIHSVIRLLTASFYTLLGHTEPERDLDGRRKYHVPAPCTLGSCYGSGRRMVGNLGFAFEENVLGGRLVAPVAATNTFYANPLVIMENVGSLSARKFYCVDDEIVRTALHWARESRRATVPYLLLHDERNTVCAEQCALTEIGVKRCNTSPTLVEPPLKKKAAGSDDASAGEEQYDVEAWKDSVLRFSDVESEGEETKDENEQNMDPAIKRLITSDHLLDE